MNFVIDGKFCFVAAAIQTRLMSHEVQETDEEFDARYVAFFQRPDIDGWEIRKVNQCELTELIFLMVS